MEEEMGRVYTPAEFAQGRIPTPEGFKRALRHLRTVVGTSEHVSGVLLFGSSFHGTNNLRSDLNCLVTFREENRRGAQAVLSRWVNFAAAQHVATEPILLEEDDAREGLHNIEPTFFVHLRFCAMNGGVLKGDPLDCVVLDGPGAKEEVLRYVCGKLSSLQKRRVKGRLLEDQRYRRLEKALEAPIYIARQVLQLSRIELPNDSKANVQASYARHMPAEMAKLLDRVVALDRAYTAGLIRLLAEKPGPSAIREYSQLVERAESVLDPSIQFVRLNARYIKRHL